MESTIGTLFGIKHYAIHDGPNIRTTVFFKGCPLSCIWCHNPEGLDSAIEVVTDNRKCIRCGACVEACPTQALTLTNGGIQRNTSRCGAMIECVRVCPALAHEPTGWTIDTPTLMTELIKDRPFYEQSGGGVTFSGGEPLQQAEFLLELLKRCGEENIHRAVDTCGFAPTEILLTIAEYTDLFLFDLKHMNSEIHRLLTGEPNELIHENISRLAELGQAMRIRFPLVPGVNADEENVRATGAFVATLRGVDQIDLLPYQSAAISKYARLGMKNSGSELEPPSPEEKDRVASILKEYGLTVRLGG